MSMLLMTLVLMVGPEIADKPTHADSAPIAVETPAMGMTREEALASRERLRLSMIEAADPVRRGEWDAREIRVNEVSMRFKVRTEGQKPADGWPLFITMHGGGATSAQVNDQQWENQIRLYEFENALVIAPRAPTDNWNLWHEPHIDPLLDRLIADAVEFGGANRNRVYLMGYSAGGDGVYQLAPRMADRFAAAAMSAGHPNDASPLSLRNLPFAIHMGADDSAFKRNAVAIEWGQTLGTLGRDDPEGYQHSVTIHPDTGHWMKQKDAAAIPWMLRHTRNSAPRRVVWKQDDVTHDQFYWLAVPPGQARPGSLVIARIESQNVIIEDDQGVEPLLIRLDDRLVDLDRPIRVGRGDVVLWEGTVERSQAVQRATFEERRDIDRVFDAQIEIKLR